MALQNVMRVDNGNIVGPVSEGGGSTVSWNQIQQSGTKIAEIAVDGVTQDVYAPAGGSGDEMNTDGSNAEPSVNFVNLGEMSFPVSMLNVVCCDEKLHAFTPENVFGVVGHYMWVNAEWKLMHEFKLGTTYPVVLNGELYLVCIRTVTAASTEFIVRDLNHLTSDGKLELVCSLPDGMIDNTLVFYRDTFVCVCEDYKLYTFALATHSWSAGAGVLPSTVETVAAAFVSYDRVLVLAYEDGSTLFYAWTGAGGSAPTAISLGATIPLDGAVVEQYGTCWLLAASYWLFLIKPATPGAITAYDTRVLDSSFGSRFIGFVTCGDIMYAYSATNMYQASWHELPYININRMMLNPTWNFFDSALTTYDDKVALVGGGSLASGTSYQKACHALGIGSNGESAWSSLVALPSNFSCGAALWYRGMLHLFGSASAGDNGGTHWAYNGTAVSVIDTYSNYFVVNGEMTHAYAVKYWDTLDKCERVMVVTARGEVVKYRYEYPSGEEYLVVHTINSTARGKLVSFRGELYLIEYNPATGSLTAEYKYVPVDNTPGDNNWRPLFRSSPGNFSGAVVACGDYVYNITPTGEVFKSDFTSPFVYVGNMDLGITAEYVKAVESKGRIFLLFNTGQTDSSPNMYVYTPGETWDEQDTTPHLGVGSDVVGSDVISTKELRIDARGNIHTSGATSVKHGILEGELYNGKLGTGVDIPLEDGAMYMLWCSTRLRTGAPRSTESFVIVAPFGGDVTGAGATTTANALPTSIRTFNNGTTGVVVNRGVFVGDDGYYHGQIGIGTCTTACRVRWSLQKVMGSEEDFA